MTTTVSEMSVAELKELIAQIVDDRIAKLLRDPDEGLELNEELVERLKHQMKEVEDGDLGESLQDVVRELGLA